MVYRLTILRDLRDGLPLKPITRAIPMVNLPLLPILLKHAIVDSEKSARQVVSQAPEVSFTLIVIRAISEAPLVEMLLPRPQKSQRFVTRLSCELMKIDVKGLHKKRVL